MPGTEPFISGWLIFGTMVAAFLLGAFWRRQPLGVALLFASIVGSLIAGKGVPIRHLVEGAFTYFDPILIIFTAMVFMRVIEENGSLGVIARWIIERLGSRPIPFLTVVTLFIMFPAMVTGISTTSVLTTGAFMAPALTALGLKPLKVGALIALVGVMGMLAPPINLLVMLIGQGVDMPYIGFEGPLAAIAFPLALTVSFSLAWSAVKGADTSAVLKKLPSLAGMHFGAKTLAPLMVVFVLMSAVRLLPSVVPDIGAPLIFVLGALTGIATGRRFNVLSASFQAMMTSLPVLGMLAGIGIFLQIMTLTGVRGMLVVEVLSLPMALVYFGMLISLPAFGGVSAFASAMVFGIPILLSLLGRNEIIACAGIALLAGLGDLLPPVAIMARFAAQIVGEGSFLKIVRICLPYLVLFALIAVAVVHWADKLSFLIF